MLIEGSGCRSPEVGMSSSAAGQWGWCIREPEGPRVGAGSRKYPVCWRGGEGRGSVRKRQYS